MTLLLALALALAVALALALNKLIVDGFGGISRDDLGSQFLHLFAFGAFNGFFSR